MRATVLLVLLLAGAARAGPRYTVDDNLFRLEAGWLIGAEQCGLVGPTEAAALMAGVIADSRLTPARAQALLREERRPTTVPLDCDMAARSLSLTRRRHPADTGWRDAPPQD